MTNILIEGYYGLGNIGDEAILSGMINSLRKYIPDANFSVLTNKPEETRNLHHVDSVEHSMKKGVLKFAQNQIFKGEFINVSKAVDKCDVFILGGGGLLQDFKPHYLPAYLSLIHLAKKRNKKTVVYGIGAGPIETKFGKYVCKKVLNQADLVTVRDIESKNALENSGVKNVVQTADPAFAIEIPKREELIEILSEKERMMKGRIFCTTFHNKLYNDDLYRKSNGTGINLDKRREIISKVFDRIINEYDCNLMCIPTAGPDFEGFVTIKQKMKKNKTFVMEHSSDFRRVLALLSKSEMLVGMRLHSMILATTWGLPFVPISYSSKVKSFLDISHIDNLYLDIEDIEKRDFESKLMENLFKVYDNRDKHSKLLLENARCFREKAFENAELVSNLIN